MNPSERREGELLIAGLGSIGRRHLANLRALGWTRVRLFRTRTSTLPDADLVGYPVEHDLAAALARRPLAVIVANPSALHLPVALAAARAGAHLLIEKPLSHALEGLDELERVVRLRRLTVLVGFQFRFHPGLRAIKAWLEAGAIGTVVSAQAHWGEYLPGMHPWEDYSRGYAARSDLGGGVLATLCHPLDYLRWLLGDVSSVSAVASGLDPLGIGVDSCVDLGLRFASGASAHVHLDFVQRPPEHRLTLIGTDGTITWSQADHAARCYSATRDGHETVAPPLGFTRNTMFVDEMRHFLACLAGAARPVCTIDDGRETAQLVATARRALAGSRPLALAT